MSAFEAHIASLGGDDAVFEHIANAEKMEDVAARFRGFIPEKPEYPSRSEIYNWIKNGGPERRARWVEAKEIAAYNLADDAEDELRKADATHQAGVSKAKAIAGMKWNKAQVFNRKDFGEEQAGPLVSLNVGQLHMEALQAGGGMELNPDRVVGRLPGPDLTVEEVFEAEIIEDGRPLAGQRTAAPLEPGHEPAGEVA